MNDSFLKALDLSIKVINGEDIPEKEIPKLNSRVQILDMYQTFKKIHFLMESLVTE
ncbi:MAG: hypothetical protein ACOC44_12550 [Promethearchaeia archaeon]